MNRTKKLTICVIAAIAIFLLIIGIHHVLKLKKGQLFESYVFEGSRLKIKVKARHEESFLLFVPGAYYGYESKTNDEDAWRPMFTFQFDDPLEIPKEQIKEINEHVIYAFIGWIYSVTTDSGKTWDIWDGTERQGKWPNYNGGFIEQIELDPSGKGTMYLFDKTGFLFPAYTNDFGKSWHIEK